MEILQWQIKKTQQTDRKTETSDKRRAAAVADADTAHCNQPAEEQSAVRSVWPVSQAMERVKNHKEAQQNDITCMHQKELKNLHIITIVSIANLLQCRIQITMCI